MEWVRVVGMAGGRERGGAWKKERLRGGATGLRFGGAQRKSGFLRGQLRGRIRERRKRADLRVEDDAPGLHLLDRVVALLAIALELVELSGGEFGSHGSDPRLSNLRDEFPSAREIERGDQII